MKDISAQSYSFREADPIEGPAARIAGMIYTARRTATFGATHDSNKPHHQSHTERRLLNNNHATTLHTLSGFKNPTLYSVTCLN
jgi:hypothetical protein